MGHVSVVLPSLGTCFLVEPYGFGLHRLDQMLHRFVFLLDTPLRVGSQQLLPAQEGIYLLSASARPAARDGSHSAIHVKQTR